MLMVTELLNSKPVSNVHSCCTIFVTSG